MSGIAKLLKRIGRQLLYGGSKPFRPYEAAIIQATLDALQPQDRAIIAVHVAGRERLQRSVKDRIVLFCYEDRGAFPVISTPAEDHCLAKVKLRDSAGTVTCAVMTCGGLLVTLEFSKSPARFRTSSVSIQSVTLHPKHPGYAGAIDREEHGATGDHAT